MAATVSIIAPGGMGAAVGGRLIENGIAVRTSLAGRSAASAARAKSFGLESASDSDVIACDILLSIVPPNEAVPLAERLAAALRSAGRKPVYVDCNAISPETAGRVAAVVEATGCGFVDAGIIGLPPKPGGAGPVFYASGPAAKQIAVLGEHGLTLRVLDKPVGAASALKMSYAGITKGLLALGSAMMLASTRAGVASELREELRHSQPDLIDWLAPKMPSVFPKAYRWVPEMEEIARFSESVAGASTLYGGAAQLYAQLAAETAASVADRDAVLDFIKS